DFTQDMKDKIRDVMEDVEKNIILILNEEIKRIHILIDEYEKPFHPDEEQLNWYKKELHEFVDRKLRNKLSNRLNSALTQTLNLTQEEIRKRVLELVESEQNRRQVANMLPREDFFITYRIDCSNLCADFKEDVNFHFSLGFTALMRRFGGNGDFNHGTSHFFADSAVNFFKKDQNSTQSNLNSFQNSNQSDNLLLLLQGFQIVANKSNMVLLAVGGIVWRGLGWKILAVTGGLYAICYLYERLMWTRKTQERVFKKQYADYASSKLKMIVGLTGQNAASQVQQELKMYLTQMCRYIDITKEEYFKEQKRYESDIKILDEVLNKSKNLKNKGRYVCSDFDKFISEFLSLEDGK
ncbi:transmembrane GTPase Marf, partial [Brachionus plicatilis]